VILLSREVDCEMTWQILLSSRSRYSC